MRNSVPEFNTKTDESELFPSAFFLVVVLLIVYIIDPLYSGETLGP